MAKSICSLDISSSTITSTENTSVFPTNVTRTQRANPENPGENICVDTATSNVLVNYPSKDLAVIATGSYSAYDAYKQQDAVSCVVCSI